MIKRVAEAIDAGAFAQTSYRDNRAMQTRRRRALEIARDVIAIVGEELTRVRSAPARPDDAD